MFGFLAVSSSACFKANFAFPINSEVFSLPNPKERAEALSSGFKFAPYKPVCLADSFVT